MSFKRKMRKQAIQKLDNLVETPDYISTVKKPRKLDLSWLKFAVPAALVVALIVATPIFITSTMKNSASDKEGGYDYIPDSEGGSSEGIQSGEDGDPLSSLSFTWNGHQYFCVEDSSLDLKRINKITLKIDFSKPISELIGIKVVDNLKKSNVSLSGYSLYHANGSNSNQILIAYNGTNHYWCIYNSVEKDLSFDDLLQFSGVDDNYRVQIYDYPLNLLHIFTDEAVTIIDSIKTVPSSSDTLLEKLKEIDKTEEGINAKKVYIFVFTDGVDCLAGEYYSQLTYLHVCSSGFNLTGTTAYTTINNVVPLS